MVDVRAGMLAVLLVWLLPSETRAQQADESRRFCVPERRARAAADSTKRLGDSLAGRLDSIRAARIRAAKGSKDMAPRLIRAGRFPVPSVVEHARAHARAEFVVDSTGRVIPCSLEMLELSDARFYRTARRRFERSLYAPGVVEGRPVAVLVVQTIRFGGGS